MEWNHVYFKSGVTLSPKVFELSLQRVIQSPFEMVFDGTYGQLWVDDDGLTCLYNSIQILQNDWLCTFTMLIVPLFDDIMNAIFNRFNESGLFTLNAILPKMLTERRISKEWFNIYFKHVSSDIAMTVKNYIEFDMSITLVGKVMYAHRNTINYRIKKFCEKSGINVRKPSNAYFIYLVMTWESKERVLV